MVVVENFVCACAKKEQRASPRGQRERWPGNPKDSIVATESLHPSTDRRRRFLVRWSYEDYFPATEYASYDAFLNTDGNPVKSESRTEVVLLQRRANRQQEESIRSFVLKIYHYPLLQRIRTGFRISKAEQDFHSLCYL